MLLPPLRRHATLACYKALSKSNPTVCIAAISSILSYPLKFENSFFGIGRRLGTFSASRTCMASQTYCFFYYSSDASQTKVALRGSSEDELDTLEALARSLNLCARSIHDAWV